MRRIEYRKLDEIEPTDFLPLLNKPTTRAHLIDHELFEAVSAKEWIQGKLDVDALPGCRVRAILVDKQLAGWCGIQLQDGNYEVAIVIGDRYWGIGKKVFQEVLGWAKAFGHKTVYLHLLHTRPEYRFLRKISKNVFESELMGRKFTTYELEVNRNA